MNQFSNVRHLDNDAYHLHLPPDDAVAPFVTYVQFFCSLCVKSDARYSKYMARQRNGRLQKTAIINSNNVAT